MQTDGPPLAQSDASPTELDLALARWATRVRENREQVDRFREVPDGADFYGPVTSMFRADPERTDDPQLEVLVGLARPDETWLDIGAGAGRFALPLARRVRRVIAVDPSAGMLTALRESMADLGIANVEVRQGRWPEAWEEASGGAAASAAAGGRTFRAGAGPDRAGEDILLDADVALMAHVGYDIEAIGPFLDAAEAAVSRLCVAILMDRQPSSSVDPFWPEIHGEARVSLPGWHELVEVLRLRGRSPQVDEVTRPRRAYDSLEQLVTFARRQLWVEPGGAKDRRLQELAAELAVREDGGLYLERADPTVAIVTWVPWGRRTEIPPRPMAEPGA